ncbi:MAG: hypothetical protein WB476_01885, partial [Azonexus sp.]
ACDRESWKLENVGGSGEAFLQPVAVDGRKMGKMPPLCDRSARRTNCLTKTVAGRRIVELDVWCDFPRRP